MSTEGKIGTAIGLLGLITAGAFALTTGLLLVGIASACIVLGVLAIAALIGFHLRDRGHSLGAILVWFGMAMLVIGGAIGFVGAFILDRKIGFASKGVELCLIYAVPQHYQNGLIALTAAVSNRSVTTRMHNVKFTFTALTTDKPMRGAGVMPVTMLDRGLTTTTPWPLDPGAYFIIIETDSGRWFESLKIDLSNDHVSQSIRILDEQQKVVFEDTIT